MNYRMKPKIVEAIQYDFDLDLESWPGVAHCDGHGHVQVSQLDIKINLGDWLVKLPEGHVIACDQNNFATEFEALQ